MKRIYFLDFMKFMAILAVVTFHSIPNEHFMMSILLHLPRVPVPFFFAAAGYLAGRKLSHSASVGTNFLLRYSLKISIVYFAALILYVLYDLAVASLIALRNNDSVWLEILHYFSESFTVLNIFYYGNPTSGYQLWFLPALIWSVLVIALFYRMNKVGLLLILSILLHMVGQLGQAYAVLLPFSMPFSTQDALFFGLCYTTLGFFLGSNKKNYIVKLNSYTAALLMVSLTLLQIAEIKFLQANANYFVSTIFLTYVLLSYVLSFPEHGSDSWFTKVGRHSLGIYIWHVLVISSLHLLASLFNLQTLYQHAVTQFLAAPLVFLLCLGILLFLQKMQLGFKICFNSIMRIDPTKQRRV